MAGRENYPLKTGEASRSNKAGLQFPIVGSLVSSKPPNKPIALEQAPPVYLAAILEYLSAEVLELAGHAASDNKKNRIVPRHIELAVRNDKELTRLLGRVTIASSGVMPNNHNMLLPKKAVKSAGEN